MKDTFSSTELIMYTFTVEVFKITACTSLQQKCCCSSFILTNTDLSWSSGLTFLSSSNGQFLCGVCYPLLLCCLLTPPGVPPHAALYPCPPAPLLHWVLRKCKNWKNWKNCKKRKKENWTYSEIFNKGPKFQSESTSAGYIWAVISVLIQNHNSSLHNNLPTYIRELCAILARAVKS